MKIKFDINVFDGPISKNWVIDTSKPLPRNMGDSKTGIIIMNIEDITEEMPPNNPLNPTSEASAG